MRDLVEYIVKAIVEHPDAVVVTETTEEGTGKLLIEVRTHTEDVGLVIGKQGRTINAIRSLVKIKAIKEGKYVDVKVPSDQ